jgi:hypothetical protein
VKVRSPAKAPMPAARARVLLTLIVRLDADGAKVIQSEWPANRGRRSGGPGVVWQPESPWTVQ